MHSGSISENVLQLGLEHFENSVALYFDVTAESEVILWLIVNLKCLGQTKTFFSEGKKLCLYNDFTSKFLLHLI